MHSGPTDKHTLDRRWRQWPAGFPSFGVSRAARRRPLSSASWDVPDRRPLGGAANGRCSCGRSVLGRTGYGRSVEIQLRRIAFATGHDSEKSLHEMNTSTIC